MVLWEVRQRAQNALQRRLLILLISVSLRSPWRHRQVHAYHTMVEQLKQCNPHLCFLLARAWSRCL